MKSNVSDEVWTKFSLDDRLRARRSGNRQPAVFLATGDLERQIEEGTAETIEAHPLRHIRERHCFGDHPERITVGRLTPISRSCPQFEKEISVTETVRCINGRQIAHKRWRNAFRSGHRIDDRRFDRFHATRQVGVGS